MVIGITGPSGSGKSTVSEILCKKYNMYLIDADAVARRITKKGTKALKEIAQTFGNSYIDENGELNRKKMANLVFSKESELKKLNKVTHKYIIEEITNLARNNEKCIIDAPLLFETGLNDLCSKIILVTASTDTRIKRIIKRDNIEENAAKQRINSQNDYEKYIPLCDLVVENDNTANLEEKLLEVGIWSEN